MKLALKNGTGYCSSCENNGDLTIVITYDDPIAFCKDCKKTLIQELIGVVKPYSQEDYEKAKLQGLDLDNWNDYEDYFEIGEKPEYD